MDGQTAPGGGLNVGGVTLDGSDDVFHEIEKHVTVPADRHGAAEFASREGAAALEDPLARKIVEAMKASKTGHHYADRAGLLDDIRFRIAAMQAFINFNSGAYDGDYFNPDLGPAPCMGWVPEKGVTGGTFWELMHPTGAEDGEFVQKFGTGPSAALKPVFGAAFPFRGECAGAFQLAVYYGLLNGLGAEAFDKMAAKFGTMYVGPWRIGDDPNPATLYMQKADLSDPPIPGDYMYFKNKDDYSKYAPDGFWTGLNAMYMGNDMLGTAHYSGLGAAWLSETNLRMTVVNAYYHDCYPHRIEDPATACRFIERYILTIPDQTEAKVTKTDGGGHATPPRPDPATLTAAGFAQTDETRFDHRHTTVGDLAQALGFDPAQIRQVPSTGLGNPAHRVRLDGAWLVLDYVDANAPRHDPAARVSATVTYTGKD